METVGSVLRDVAAPDTEVFSVTQPVPGLGVLPVNAFLIRAAEPVLVDAGIVALEDDFFAALTHAIDPRDLRYIWLTHTDSDHLGCLHRVLDAAPHARVVTSFLGLGKLGLARGVLPERAYLINPGQALDVGDRELIARRPAYYDAPETTGLFDTKTRALFSVDCFGALMDEVYSDARAIPRERLAQGLATWGQIDAPWLSQVASEHYQNALQALRSLRPEYVLSSHLAPARGMLDELLQMLDGLRASPPFVGPDQAAMAQMALSA